MFYRSSENRRLSRPRQKSVQAVCHREFCHEHNQLPTVGIQSCHLTFAADGPRLWNSFLAQLRN